jgi:hypothetical protein
MEIERILERKKRGGRVCERENIWKKVKIKQKRKN